MMREPLISVVITYYNGEQYIAEAIDSVLSQSYKNFEIIVVNDGSKQSALEALSLYQNRIKIVSQTNGDVSKARNVGVDESNGEIIAFLDQDDFWDKDKLRKHAESFEKKRDLDLSYCELIKIYNDGSQSVQKDKISISKLIEGKDIFEILAKKNLLMPSAVAVKKDSFIKAGKFNPEFKTCGDYEMWLRMASLDMKFSYEDYFGVFYRIHENNESKKIGKMNMDRLKAVETAFSYPWLSEKRKEYKNVSLSSAYLEAGYSCFSYREYEGAKRYLVDSIKLNPASANIKTISRLLRAIIKSKSSSI